MAYVNCIRGIASEPGASDSSMSGREAIADGGGPGLDTEGVMPLEDAAREHANDDSSAKS